MPKHFPGVDQLLWVMEQLRDPDTGCPWDKEQSFKTIVPYTIEEAYEVADAIEHGDMDDIQDELGDLLFQVVFYAKLGDEQGAFDFDNIAQHVAQKLIRRHPHVFDSASFASEEELNANWEATKKAERQAKGVVEDESILANIPRGMAPAQKAVKLQKRCAKVGFDWDNPNLVADKIHEEVAEVLEAMQNANKGQAEVEEEIGDLMFAVTNLARHCKVNPDQALIAANNKFERRFRAVENAVKASNEALQDQSLEVMEAMWQQVKKAEKV